MYNVYIKWYINDRVEFYFISFQQIDSIMTQTIIINILGLVTKIHILWQLCHENIIAIFPYNSRNYLNVLNAILSFQGSFYLSLVCSNEMNSIIHEPKSSICMDIYYII